MKKTRLMTCAARRRQGKVMISILLVIVILAAAVGGAFLLKKFGPKAEKEEPKRFVQNVETLPVQLESHEVEISTQGMVQPVRQTRLSSEVAGRVMRISPKLKVGGEFEAGEEMLAIDDADFRTMLANNKSVLAEAKLALELEQARGQQALRDWNKLGRGGEASDLVLRKPQLASAQARVEAAQAAVEKAERDLTRTSLKAPYRCRVETVAVEEGAYVAPSAAVAHVYGIDAMELRLPLSLEEVGFLPVGDGKWEVPVTVSAEIGGQTMQWEGSVVRNEGGVDRNTLSMTVVAHITPNTNNSIFPLPPKGLFAEGKFHGKTLTKIVKLPRYALREGNVVWVMSDDKKLSIKQVSVLLTNNTHAVVSSGLSAGDAVVVSPIAIPVEGMELFEEKDEKSAEPTENK